MAAVNPEIRTMLANIQASPMTRPARDWTKASEPMRFQAGSQATSERWRTATPKPEA